MTQKISGLLAGPVLKTLSDTEGVYCFHFHNLRWLPDHSHSYIYVLTPNLLLKKKLYVLIFANKNICIKEMKRNKKTPRTTFYTMCFCLLGKIKRHNTSRVFDKKIYSNTFGIIMRYFMKSIIYYLLLIILYPVTKKS